MVDALSVPVAKPVLRSSSHQITTGENILRVRARANDYFTTTILIELFGGMQVVVFGMYSAKCAWRLTRVPNQTPGRGATRTERHGSRPS